jgi:hypothetical protein
MTRKHCAFVITFHVIRRSCRQCRPARTPCEFSSGSGKLPKKPKQGKRATSKVLRNARALPQESRGRQSDLLGISEDHKHTSSGLPRNAMALLRDRCSGRIEFLGSSSALKNAKELPSKCVCLQPWARSSCIHCI